VQVFAILHICVFINSEGQKKPFPNNAADSQCTFTNVVCSRGKLKKAKPDSMTSKPLKETWLKKKSSFETFEQDKFTSLPKDKWITLCYHRDEFF
jgi:hypothetical protein